MKSKRLAKLLYWASSAIEDAAEKYGPRLHSAAQDVDPDWKPLPPMTMTEQQREANRFMSQQLLKMCEVVYGSPDGVAKAPIKIQGVRKS